MTIQEWLAENLDGCPCNFSPIDEKMAEYCIEHFGECDCDNGKECWSRVIKAYGITNVTDL